ncbi:MAG: glycosyltransferase family 4 protein [Ignavibacteriales bacterium]|nr:glycosyltransferase family 4 protein [Ignavibacteriales bacterium]
MKLLHINSYDRKGGAETIFNITRCNLISAENYSGFVKLKDSPEVPDISFTSWEVDNKILGSFNYIFSIHNYFLLKNFLNKESIDIIHLHGFFASISPSILLAIKKIKKNNHIRVIQTLHDFHLICPNASLYNYANNNICEKCIGKKYKFFIFKDKCDRRGRIHSILKGIRSLVANNILGHRDIIDQFISPSDFLKHKMIEDGIDEKKIIVIRNPIINYMTKSDSKKENLICYFGRFSKEKNLEFLIAAFSLWKMKTNNDFRLLLIGEGEEENKLRELAKTSNCNDSIVFKKFVQNEELVNNIKLAKYFCMTSSWYENAPLSILEALSLNIIPIVPNIGGMDESIRLFNIGRTYESGNYDSFLDSITTLETSYDLILEELRQKKEDISKCISLKNYHEGLSVIYTKLLTHD